MATAPRCEAGLALGQGGGRRSLPGEAHAGWLMPGVPPPHMQSAALLESEPYVRSLAWDPDGNFLAATDAHGCLAVYEPAASSQNKTKRKKLPKVRGQGGMPAAGFHLKQPSASCLNPPLLLQVDLLSSDHVDVAWLLEGSLLAAPGTDSNVVLYESLSWEVSQHLSHTASVSVLAASPNGEPCTPPPSLSFSLSFSLSRPSAPAYFLPPCGRPLSSIPPICLHSFLTCRCHCRHLLGNWQRQ
jgi:hypothetical protein